MARVIQSDEQSLLQQKDFRDLDVLVLLGVLSYHPDPKAFLDKLLTLVKRGGHVIFSFQNADSPFQQRNIRLLKDPYHHSFPMSFPNTLDSQLSRAVDFFSYYPEPFRLWRLPFLCYGIYLIDSLSGLLLPQRYACSMLVTARKVE